MIVRCRVPRIKELTARVTDKAIERAALSKSWVLEKLCENAEKALEAPHGSSVANRALELLGTEPGMSGDQPPPQPPTSLEDLPSEILEQILRESAAAEEPATEVTQ
jgi:hypothetical protein